MGRTILKAIDCSLLLLLGMDICLFANEFLQARTLDSPSISAYDTIIGRQQELRANSVLQVPSSNHLQ